MIANDEVQKAKGFARPMYAAVSVASKRLQLLVLDALIVAAVANG